jgi:hypothetical protein
MRRKISPGEVRTDEQQRGDVLRRPAPWPSSWASRAGPPRAARQGAPMLRRQRLRDPPVPALLPPLVLAWVELETGGGGVRHGCRWMRRGRGGALGRQQMTAPRVRPRALATPPTAQPWSCRHSCCAARHPADLERRKGDRDHSLLAVLGSVFSVREQTPTPNSCTPASATRPQLTSQAQPSWDSWRLANVSKQRVNGSRERRGSSMEKSGIVPCRANGGEVWRRRSGDGTSCLPLRRH